jgi:peptidoglycan/xylan/chitin deacetylase (PgdA/CDA1 family)
MHLKKHVMYICLGLLILGLIYFLALSDIFHPKQVASYENFTEISEEYDATEEINEATETYAKSADMARIVKGTPGTDKKVIYLTFNGMESRGNMEGILKAMLQHGFHGTFFVEGANAAHEEKVTQKLVDEDQLIGNYGFVGLTKAERLDADRLIEQFCKTQKVLSLVAGKPATYFALPETRYLPSLLRAAKACGLDYAVESDIVVKESDFIKPNGVENLMNQIQPGMVVSIRLDHPVPIIFYHKTDAAAPAIDKKPTIKDDFATDNTDVPIVDAVKNLCEILKSQGYTVETVDKLPSYDVQDIV